MFSIQAPTMSGKAVFDACVPHSTDADLIKRLTLASPSIAAAERDFKEAVASGDPSAYFKHARRPFACPPEDLRDLYRRVLRDGGQRAVYEKLVFAGNERPCPICGASIAGSLDHYLPVSSAPELSVVPINLIPTCLPCNRDKRDHTPATLDECLFNPFFDSWLDYPMLIARLIFEGGPRVEFDMEQPIGCPNSVYRRARKTFDVYKFAKNLKVAAATHFRSVKAAVSFPFLPDELRPIAIERWLRHQNTQLAAKNSNDWQAAMYKAFADSEQFLSGGYELLPD
jgi:hypothetical protein